MREGVEYPAVLLESGDSDTRVPPAQARKMTARLQAATSSDRPILLLYEMADGHAGEKTVTEQTNEYADELAFVTWQLGLDLDLKESPSGPE